MGLHKQDSVIAADGENGFGPARTYDRPERVGTGTRGPLLHDTQLPQHPGSVTDQAEPVSPISRSHVTHHPEPMCHASGGTKHLRKCPGQEPIPTPGFKRRSLACMP